MSAGDSTVITSGAYIEPGTGIPRAKSAGVGLFTERIRTTAGNVNTGATLLPALPGLKYRIVDFTAIAIGGNASGATSVDILGTQAAAGATLAAMAIAALTRSTAVKPNSANVTLLADGASHSACDAGTAITIGKTGGSLATATHVDVILTYAIESA